MPIDTHKAYNSTMKHPFYIKITKPEQNDYKLNSTYEIRIPDEYNGEEGPYHYVHECILTGKHTQEWSEVPNLLKAYTAQTKDPKVAESRIHPLGENGKFEDDEKVVVLIFMRIDKTKKLIVSGDDIQTGQDADIEDYKDA